MSINQSAFKLCFCVSTFLLIAAFIVTPPKVLMEKPAMENYQPTDGISGNLVDNVTNLAIEIPAPVIESHVGENLTDEGTNLTMKTPSPVSKNHEPDDAIDSNFIDGRRFLWS